MCAAVPSIGGPGLQIQTVGDDEVHDEVVFQAQRGSGSLGLQPVDQGGFLEVHLVKEDTRWWGWSKTLFLCGLANCHVI